MRRQVVEFHSFNEKVLSIYGMGIKAGSDVHVNPAIDLH